MTEAEVRALLADVGVDDLLEVLVTSVDAGAAKPDPAAARAGPAAARARRSRPACSTSATSPPTPSAAEAAGMPYADVAGGTIALAVSTWVERMAGSRFEAARGAVVPTDGTAVGRGRRATRTASPSRRDRSVGSRAPSIQLAAIAGVSPPPVPEPAVIAVFAADHGVLASGRVAVAAGGHRPDGGQLHHRAAPRSTCWPATPGPRSWWSTSASPPRCSPRAGCSAAGSRPGTADLARGPAMSRTEALLALDVGAEMAGRAVAGGARCLITGDMGIGNTTPSAALIAAITGRPPAEVTGRGAGADDVVLARKIGGHRDARSNGCRAPPAR